MNLRERFVDSIQSVTPGYKLVPKEDSRLMKFLAIILFFNGDFMSRYTTTVGSTVYMPKDHISSGTRNLSTLAHEAQHVWDHNRWYGHIFYAVGYILPQVLALGALLSLLAIWFSNWWLLALLSLVFLAPIPAPARMAIERRGYLMSLACEWWMYGRDGVSEYTWPVDNFASGDYYWMWPFRKGLVSWFVSELEQIKSGSYPTPVFKVVHEFLKSENLTK